MSAPRNYAGRDVDDARQFLTFELAGEEYGVGILKVREIRVWSPVTGIPHAPRWLLGVINLRGTVVPIVDLRIKFNFERAAYGESNVVIILNVGEQIMGIVVDAVSDVVSLSSAQIKPPPSLGGHADTSHIIGFGTADERMRILMDVDRLMSTADVEALRTFQ